MKTYRFKEKRHSPSRQSVEFGKQIFFGFKIGIIKAQVDEVKSKFELYKLPCRSWVQSYAPFNENTLEEIKRWYDIDY